MDWEFSRKIENFRGRSYRLGGRAVLRFSDFQLKPRAEVRERVVLTPGAASIEESARVPSPFSWRPCRRDQTHLFPLPKPAPQMRHVLTRASKELPRFSGQVGAPKKCATHFLWGARGANKGSLRGALLAFVLPLLCALSVIPPAHSQFPPRRGGTAPICKFRFLPLQFY